MRPSVRTILLIEDEALIAMEQAGLRREEGYVVSHAIDLLLMDIDLGRGMDGARAAKEILKEQDIPILLLSARTEKEVVEKTEKITSYGTSSRTRGREQGWVSCARRIRFERGMNHG
jgi:CheY-like chemotaxis protein